MSKVIGDEPCPRCRENGKDKNGDHLMIFEDGGKYCNRCEYTVAKDKAEVAEVDESGPITMELAATLPHLAVPDRGLAAEDMEFYGHRCTVDPATGKVDRIVYPRYIEGVLTGYKIKTLGDKSAYRSIGDSKGVDLVGQNLPGGMRMCIITEGEDDMVAARSMLRSEGKDYRVVSLPNGSSVALSDYAVQFLESFETLIIATDMDDAGNTAASKIAEHFDPRKCKRAALSRKDANEMLLADESREFLAAINHASVLTADGVVMGDETWQRMLDYYRSDMHTGILFPDSMSKLNEMTYGFRQGELDTWTSGSGSGKTQVLREIIHHLAVVNDAKVGLLELEEPTEDTVIGQMSIAANLPLHLPDIRSQVSDKDLKRYWQATLGTGNYAIYDHFGSLGDSVLMNKIRYMAAGLGCTHIVLDHLSIVVSEYADDGDERKVIDKIMTQLKRLTQELNIWIGIVVHLRKAGGTPFELGAVPSVDDLRGSGGIKHLSNQVYALSRNQQHPDIQIRNTSLVTVLKSRFSGRTGPADLLEYGLDTGRMLESPLDMEQFTGTGRTAPSLV